MARGVSQEGWAALLGVGRTTVQRWERGESPPDAASEDALVALCEERGLFRELEAGPLRGLLLNERLVRDLLGEARLSHRGVIASPTEAERSARVGSASRGTVFVGRSHELEVLRSALDDAFAGRGSVVLIGGEPGIGKTRLLDELESEASGRGVEVLWGAMPEGAAAPAYWPWIRIARAHIAQATQNRLREELRGAASELCKLLPELRELVPGLTQVEIGSQTAGEFRLLDACASLLIRVAAHRPILIVLDDLHAADAPTLAMLEHVAREIRGSPILIAGTYRDTEVTIPGPLSGALVELRRNPRFRHLHLRGLTQQDVAAYIREIASSSAPSGLAAHLFERTDGNPLFVAEIVDLILQKDASFDDAIRRLEIPMTVREAFGGRISQLSPRTKELLTIAALVGREVTFSFLNRVAGSADPGPLLARIDEAIDSWIITEAGAGRYRFRHALMMEALLAEVPASRRIELEAIVAEGLEALYADNIHEHAAVLASHFAAAWPISSAHAERAVRYTRLAATQAEASFARSEAARLYEQCLDLISASGQDFGTDVAALLAARGRCLDLRDPRGWQSLRRAVELLGERGDVVGQARALASVDLVDQATLWAVSTDGSGRGYQEVVDEVLAALGHRDAHLRARLLLTRAAGEDGPAAISAAEEASNLADRYGFADIVGLLRRRDAFVRWDPGGGNNRASGRRMLDASRALAEAGLEYAAARAYFTAIWDPVNAGRLDEARAHAKRALAYGRRTGDLRAVHGAILVEAEVAFLRSEWDRFEQIVAEVPSHSRDLAALRVSRAEATGDFDIALELLGQPRVEPPTETHGARARVLLHAGRVNEAQQEMQAWWAAREQAPGAVTRSMADFYIEDALIAFADDEQLRALDGERTPPWPRGSAYESASDRTVLCGPTGHSWDRYVGLRELRLGHIESAATRIETGISWAKRERCPVLEGRLHQALAEVAFASRDRRLALKEVDEAAELFERNGTRTYLEQLNEVRRKLT